MFLRVELDIDTPTLRDSERVNGVIAFALRAFADDIEHVADLRGVDGSGVNEKGVAYQCALSDCNNNVSAMALVINTPFEPAAMQSAPVAVSQIDENLQYRPVAEADTNAA